MKRGGFLKALAVLAASPKIISELKPRKKEQFKGAFRDIKFVDPTMCGDVMAKFGDKSFTEIMQEMGKYPSNTEFHFFDYPKNGNR